MAFQGDETMEFRIAKSAFLKGLARAQSVVDTRNVRPILGYVLLEASGSELVLCATDIEVGIKVRYPAEVVEGGKIALSAKKLYEIVKELPREEVLIKELPNCWAEIVCGAATFKLMGLPPDEFPSVAEISGEVKIEFTRDLLREMIERTLFAVSTDESRYHINGVFLQVLPAEAGEEGIASRIRFVATDGHRLSIVDKPYPFETPDLSYGVIVPRKGFAELRKALDDGEEKVTLGFVENDGIVETGNLLMTMRLIEGDFPNYQQVVPKEPDKVFVVSRKAFLDAMRRISILTSEKSKIVRLDITSSELTVSTNNPDFGEARETIPIEYDGPGMAVGYNSRYFLDVLSILSSDKVVFSLLDDMSPAVLRPQEDSNFSYIVMPVRL